MDKFEILEKKYEEHFKAKFPQRIIGYWDPVHDTTEYIETIGYQNMKLAIDKAIKENEPIEEIPEEIWDTMAF